MTDILLIQPPIRDFYLTAKRTIPYGLACIAASLQKNCFSVEIFDGLATTKSHIIELPEEMEYLREYYHQPDISPFSLFYHYRHYGYSFQHIGSVAKKSGAFLVGISSLFTPYADEALKTADVVKTYHPQCKVVLGGHHPTSLPEKVLKNKSVDFVIRGEGEVSMSLLASAIKNNMSFEEIPGIAFRKSDGTLHTNPPAVMKSLDYYPKPAMELIKHRYYKRAGQGGWMMMAGRGCPMKCTYCSVSANSYVPYRRRSSTSVLEEIEAAVDGYGAGFIDFEDENLSFNKKWFLEILLGIKDRFKNKKLELRAMNGLFPNALDEPTIKAMKDAGFTTLNLSLCSISPSHLKRFNRPDTQRAFEKVLALASKYGLETVSYIIVGGPHQNPHDSVKDLLYLAKQKTLVGVSVFYPSPGSNDYNTCHNLGLLPDHLSLTRSTAIPVAHTTSRIETLTLLRIGRIINFIKQIDKKGHLKPNQNRIQMGKQLLEKFLQTGKIHGISPDNEVFDHNISLELTRDVVDILKC